MSQLHCHSCSPKAAWEALEADPKAVLVDVRTSAEWNADGVPSLDDISKNLITIEWRTLPNMSVNPQFTTHLIEAVPDKESTIFFICRSAARSDEAATFARSIGYKNCINVSGGFTGGNNESVDSWKSSKLPWRQ
ncbi:MAG: rhodanese-like domain-containing protein [Alphaproteobacteria bacterium]|jgi:rhodanese-related sulfurtransferase|nr:rhodanese-like domain-containing protein [Candidatus Jidaibacter sp.]